MFLKPHSFSYRASFLYVRHRITIVNYIASFVNGALPILSDCIDIFQEEDVYWMDVVMDMTSDDERFGFSVMGGVEEGFLPRVDEISIGRSCY